MPQGNSTVLVQRRPHGGRGIRAANERLRRQNLPSLADSPDLTPKKRCALALSFLAVIFSMGLVIYIGGIIYTQHYTLNLYNYLEDETMNSTSKMLEKLVDHIERLRTIEIQFLHMMDLTRLTSAVKKELQPVQDAITRLTTTTSKYEQMKRSASNKPNQFISSALEELKNIEKKLDETEIDKIVNEDSALASQLLEEWTFIAKEKIFILDCLEDPKLMDDNIIISPTAEIDAIDGGKYIDNLIIEHPIDEVVEVMKNLIPLVKRREENTEKIYELLKELGIDQANDEDFYISNVEKMLDDYMKGEVKNIELFENYALEAERNMALNSAVMNYVEDNEELIQLFLPHDSIVSVRVGDLAANFSTNYQKRRKGLLQMSTQVLKDIGALKIRIQKL